MSWFKERLKKQYYIDTYGDVHKVKDGVNYDQHSSIHYAISKNLYPDQEYPCDHVMNKLGWICVGSSVYNAPIINKKPTQKQLDTLFDLDLLKRLLIKKNNQYINYDRNI